MRKTLAAFAAALVLLVVAGNALRAGTTGKITGRVVDEQTGDPLPSANVLLEGTTMGAATDIDGYYVILNVPPGVYTLRVTMIGFATKRVTGVRVVIDQTTVVNVSLTPEVIEGREVVVEAERPVVEKDVAATKKNISANVVEKLPAADVREVLGLSVGISTDLTIRGSSANQALFMVDGIVLRDERNNQPITAVPLSAVQEISVQTGGFGAEYNNVRSGVVNVVTKEGSRTGYAGTITFKYRPPAPKHFGISPYDPKSYWLRPYLDPDVCWTGTASGAWDEYMQRQYPSFEGWIAVSERTLQDNDPTNDLTPEAAQRLFRWQHRKQGDIKKGDYYFDGGFGGPVPGIGRRLGNLRFYASFLRRRDMYLFRLSREALETQSSMLKLTSDITPSLKLSATALYGEVRGTTRSRTGGTALMQSTYDIASALNQAGFTVPWRIYTDIYWCPTSQYFHSFAAKLTHVLNPTTYYELQVKRVGRKYFTMPGRSRNKEKKYEIFPGYFVDEAPQGFEEQPIFGIGDYLGMGGAVSTSRDYSRVVAYTVKADLVSQVTRNHEINAGLQFVYDDFNISFGMVNKFLPEGNFWTKIDRNPYRMALYVQDKLEYQGFIAILGGILDYTNPNGNWYDVDPYDRIFFSEKFRPELEPQFLTKKAKPRLTLSPRLAISHPITDRSKLYFNYGHYREVATSERLYRVQRDLRNKVDYIGDPTLPLARTVAYELGYDQSLFDTYLLHISAYYKDISNQEFWVRYISFDGKVNYRKLTANSYEDIRGFEVELTKMWGKWLTGTVNYEYRVGTGGYFGSAQYYENPAEQREYLRRNPKQFKPRPRPRLKAIVGIHTPMDFGPSILGQKPLGGWLANFIARWTAGGWFTWNPNNVPGIEYNVKWRDYHNVDLRMSKIFRLGKFDLKLFMDIYNLFNFRYFSGVSFSDFYDYQYYMKSLHLPASVADPLGYGNIPGDDQPGDYRKEGVEYVPMEWTASTEDLLNPNPRAIYYDAKTKRYMQWVNDQWVEVEKARIDKILEDKAYIDMPNQTFITFLNPRSIFFGITLSWHF